MEKFRKSYIILIILAITVVPARGQDVGSDGVPHPHGITSSGLGTVIMSEGNTFDITGGTQKGANLFHSFGKFNVHSGESAVFHDAGIENTVGRVTGGDYSWINGTLRSGAENLYLMNPAGVMFGPGASLDVSGSFHVTTADYLRMGENERFYALPQANEVLSVAAPAAFGFLDDTPAPIMFQGSGSEVAEEYLELNGIKVPEGKTLSVIGGDVGIASGMITDDIRVETRLQAPGGRMNIAGVASPGEVVPAESDLDVRSLSKLGNITVSDGSFATVTGEGAGNVYIRGENFVMDNGNAGEHSEIPAGVYATTLGDTDGGGIDIRLDGDMTVSNGGEIMSNGFGSGDGRRMRIEAENVNLTNRGIISAYNGGTGKGTDIEISAEGSVSVSSDAYIFGYTDAESAGGGKISIRTKDSLHLSDSKITTSVSQGEGGGGDISIGNTEAKTGPRFVILNHSRIRANADEGDGGAIFIVTDNYLRSSDSVTEAKSKRGNEGTVKIEAPDVDISKDLTVISATPLDASRWLKKTCAERTGEDVSRFVIRGRDSVPLSFEAWIPGPAPGFGRPVSKN